LPVFSKKEVHFRPDRTLFGVIRSKRIFTVPAILVYFDDRLFLIKAGHISVKTLHQEPESLYELMLC
jgi:hypothetical protein